MSRLLNSRCSILDLEPEKYNKKLFWKSSASITKEKTPRKSKSQRITKKLSSSEPVSPEKNPQKMIFQSNFLNSIYKQSKFSYKKHIIPKTERNAPQIQFNDSAKFPIFSLDMPKTHFKTSSSTYSLSIKPMAASPRVINLNIQDKSQQFLPKYTEPKSHRFSERKQRPLSSNMTRTNGVSLLESDLETFVVGNLVKPSSKEARIKKRLQDMDIKDYKREGEPYLQYLFYKKRL